jgi:hypothetical protein
MVILAAEGSSYGQSNHLRRARHIQAWLELGADSVSLKSAIAGISLDLERGGTMMTLDPGDNSTLCHAALTSPTAGRVVKLQPEASHSNVSSLK